MPAEDCVLERSVQLEARVRALEAAAEVRGTGLSRAEAVELFDIYSDLGTEDTADTAVERAMLPCLCAAACPGADAAAGVLPLQPKDAEAAYVHDTSSVPQVQYDEHSGVDNHEAETKFDASVPQATVQVVPLSQLAEMPQLVVQ